MRSIALVSVMCAGLAFSTGCHPGHMHRRVPVSENEAIFVSGEGEAKSPPDRMRLQLGVEAKAETLDAAIADSNKRSHALREALLKLGVAEKDMKTGQFSIQQIREPVVISYAESPPAAAPASSPAKGKPAVTTAPAPMPITRTEERWVERYQVSNTLDVTYPDLSRAGELISAAVAAGANNSWGLSFEITDPKPLQNQAREAALVDAKARAEQIAKATGVKLGRVLSVSDGGNGGGGPTPPMPMYKMTAMDSSVPIEGGETKISAAVQVVYAIERD